MKAMALVPLMIGRDYLSGSKPHPKAISGGLWMGLEAKRQLY